MTQRYLCRKSICAIVFLIVPVVALQENVGDEINGNGIPHVRYNPLTGDLTINPDEAQLISLLIPGPAATQISRWQDGTSSDGIIGWRQQYFDGKEQWIGEGSALSNGFVVPTTAVFRIAVYPTGLKSSDFGLVEIGVQDPLNPPRGRTLFTNVSGDEPTIACDFDNDGDCDVNDINQLTRVPHLKEGVVVPSPNINSKFDMDGNRTVNCADVSRFLVVAAEENGWGEPYRLGDTDLDGKVGFADFVNMNNNWQKSVLPGEPRLGWQFGDFDCDGMVTFPDFVAQNNNWQSMLFPALSFAPLAVPEPSTGGLVALGLLFLGRRLAASVSNRHRVRHYRAAY